jgi:thymidylate synthase (FAD)
MEVELVNHSTVDLIQSDASDNMVALAAWVSNDQDNEDRLENRAGVEGLINFLYSNSHNSPFEHGQFTFKLDVPIFVAREHHRHRTQSYNEISGRYTQMKPRFYMPSVGRPKVQKGKIGAYEFEQADTIQNNNVWRTIMQNSYHSWNRYEHLKQDGIANEVARMVLPLNLMTQYYATMSPRNLMQFLTLRTDMQALYEIRDVANQMEGYFKAQMPLTYKAYKKSQAEYAEFKQWKANNV